MLSEPIADVCFIVPNGLEQMNEVVLSRSLPAALHDKGPVFKVFYVEGCLSLPDVSQMVLEAAG